MRKLMTTVATAVTLGVMGFAAPALADNYPYQGNNGQAYQNQPYNNGGGYQGQGQWNQGGNYDDRGFQPDRRFDNRRRGKPEMFVDLWAVGEGVELGLEFGLTAGA